MNVDTVTFLTIFGFGCFITVAVLGFFIFGYVDKLRADYIHEMAKKRTLESRLNEAFNYLAFDKPLIAFVLFWVDYQYCTIEQLRLDIEAGRCDTWESFVNMKGRYYQLMEGYDKQK